MVIFILEGGQKATAMTVYQKYNKTFGGTIIWI